MAKCTKVLVDGERKRCKECDEMKHYTEYKETYNGRGLFGRRAECKECAKKKPQPVTKYNKEVYKKYRNNHTERLKEYERRRVLKSYGISPEEYDSMLINQGGVCAICGLPEVDTDRTGKIKFLSVDHNHTTGQVRELLCGRCNRGIGLLGDNTNTLGKALEYISKHEEKMNGTNRVDGQATVGQNNTSQGS